MTTIQFQISEEKCRELLSRFPNLEKNIHVGGFAIEIAKLYFLSRDADAGFTRCKGGDIGVTCNGRYEEFEVKGTADPNICFKKLKVSSKACHDALVNGMRLIRITGIGKPVMNIHFMKHPEDFILVEEPRWAVKPAKQ
jgi:hypothetical protein